MSKEEEVRIRNSPMLYKIPCRDCCYLEEMQSHVRRYVCTYTKDRAMPMWFNPPSYAGAFGTYTEKEVHGPFHKKARIYNCDTYTKGPRETLSRDQNTNAHPHATYVQKLRDWLMNWNVR